jgi:iron complex outermembrane recepter protein
MAIRGGKQYGTLDNIDPNGFIDTEASRFLIADVRLQYKVGKQWQLSGGIDNLNNKKHGL